MDRDFDELVKEFDTLNKQLSKVLLIKKIKDEL